MLTSFLAGIPFVRRITPKKIDLYILTEVLSPFLGGVIFFSFVFLMSQVLRLADFMIVHGIPGLIILKLTSLLLLSFQPNAMPISFLISILVGFGRLSADSELVAMKAHGISIYRMAIPVVTIAVLVSALSLALNLEWVPWGEREFKSTLIRVSNTKAVSSIQEGTFTSNFFDLLIYAEKVDPKLNRMSHVFLYDERDHKNPMTIVAQRGELIPLKTSSKLATSLILRLFSGNIHRNDIEEKKYQRIDFESYDLFLEVAEGQDNKTEKPKMVPFDELLDRMKTDKDPNRRREFTTEFWRRISVGMSPFIFVFLGIGFGTFRTRSVRAGAILIAFAVILSYWLMQLIATNLAHNGTLPPALTMHLPNLITFLIGLYVFKRATW